MGKVDRKRQLLWLVGTLLQLFLLTDCTVGRQRISKTNLVDFAPSPPVQLHRSDDHVVVDNGLVNITFSTPEGMVIGIQYNGVDNILEENNKESNRGYWDVVWSKIEQSGDIYDKLEGTHFSVIMEHEDQVELSFTKIWNPSLNDTGILLNVDKRYIVLRGITGFYSYAIFERLEEWSDMVMYQGRIVFKLQEKLFRYMAMSDERQRIMPTPEDRERGEPLAYPEAVRLTNPSNPFLKGEVDDKYQYSTENKDNRVHGWICSDPPVGFWMITPSNEFRTGGPVKQYLTSHAGPITLVISFGHRLMSRGYFLIKNVRAGNYSLYGWVPGFIGSRTKLGEIEYVPPRNGNGPTLWEVGIPDRTAAEFYVPGPNPTLMNQLYVERYAERFRQYGLWDRYTDLYPDQDLVYNVSVTRNIGNKTYVPTTWKILFDLEEVNESGNYTLRLALASATTPELQVRINDEDITIPYFTTGLIGQDNAIARHEIHGLYLLYTVNVWRSMLQNGRNTIFLTQAMGGRPFRGVMYDYIRLERPMDEN